MRIRIMSRDAMTTMKLTGETIGQLLVKAKIGQKERVIATLFANRGEVMIQCADHCWFIDQQDKRPQFEQRTFKKGQLFQIVVEGKTREEDEEVSIFFEPNLPGSQSFVSYAIPTSEHVVVGGGKMCQIRYDGLGDAAEAFEIYWDAEQHLMLYSFDRAKWNVYCNGEAVCEQRLKEGDSIYCGGLRILIGPRMLQVNNPDGRVFCNLLPFDQPQYVKLSENPMHNTLFHISPAQPLLPETETIHVEVPPEMQTEQQENSMLLTMLPGIMMALAMVLNSAIAVSGANSENIASVISSMVMVLCMLISCIIPIFNRRQNRRRIRRVNEELTKDYIAYLDKLSKRIDLECKVEMYNLQLRNPPLSGKEIQLIVPGNEQAPNTLVMSCEARSKMNGSKGLWERRPADRDFLHIAVGSGDFDMACSVVKPEKPQIGEVPELYSEMEKRLEKLPTLLNAPVILDLRLHKLIGIVGDRKNVLRQVLGMLVELTALHSYEDLRIAVIYSNEEHDFWDFVKWIPHTWDAEGDIRYLANDESEIKSLSQLLKSQLGTIQNYEQKNGSIQPWTVLINADQGLGSRAEVLREFYKSTGESRLTVIELCETEKMLPKNCTAILDVGKNEAAKKKLSLRHGGMHSEQALKTLVCYDGDAKGLFTNMSHIRLSTLERGKGLPDSLSYLDMLQVGNREELNIRYRWKQSDPVKSIKTVLGCDRDGFPVILDLHEKAHGPHGVVAGMTGSGKSELLTSMILDLAVNYDPREVAFVLIDFKGGGMADTFRSLPHLAGTITNLDGNELRRSFLAIESELEHRQQIFKKVSGEHKLNSMNIYTYQRMFREDKVRDPMPHLFIISDEFAELKHFQNDIPGHNDDFMKQLIRIARIGRSLGVHLILATQKPEGVVDDQIRSNVRFKICLKVQDRSDSQSMIGCPDAAAITRAGRFYLQVGMNEVFELGQSGYTGVPYEPQNHYEPPKDLLLDLLNEQGRVVMSSAPKTKSSYPDFKQISAVLETICDAAKAENISQRPLWASALPVVKQSGAKRAVEDKVAVCVGQYDDLYDRTHKPVMLSISNGGNAVLYGAAGSGKVEFVNRVLLECVTNYRADELILYLADAESGAMQAFENCPHTAFLALPGEGDRYTEMLVVLEQLLKKRREILKSFGGDLEQYLKTGEKMPYCLCVINDLGSFLNEGDASGRLDSLKKLASVGKKYGMVLFITGTDSRSIHYSLQSMLSQVYVLNQTSSDEYDMLLGKTRGIRPVDGRGRGLIRVDTPGRNGGSTICEFQVDIPFQNEDNSYAALCRYVEEKNCKDGVLEPKKIPRTITAEDMEECSTTREDCTVGVDYDGNLISWNFKEKHVLNCTLPKSIPLIRGILSQTARMGVNGRMLVLDGTGNLVKQIADHCEIVSGDAMEERFMDFWNDFKKCTDKAFAVYQETKKVPQIPFYVIAVCDTEKVFGKLSRETRMLVEQLLKYSSKSVPLCAVLFTDFERVNSQVLSMQDNGGGLVRDGLVLQPAKRSVQYLFDCPNLTANMTGGIVCSSKFIPAKFLEA